MDINKQIDYWKNTGADDLETAEVLLKNNKILHSLFFCHLCIEKILKANVVRCTNNVPPKVHKLSYLLSLTDLEVSEKDKDFFGLLMAYMLEGRYPDYNPDIPSVDKANEYLLKTKELFECLRKKL